MQLQPALRMQRKASLGLSSPTLQQIINQAGDGFQMATIALFLG